jgi:hypothetical protein
VTSAQVTNQVVEHGGHCGDRAQPIIQVKAKTANDFKIPFRVNGADGVSDAAAAINDPTASHVARRQVQCASQLRSIRFATMLVLRALTS